MTPPPALDGTQPFSAAAMPAAIASPTSLGVTDATFSGSQPAATPTAVVSAVPSAVTPTGAPLPAGSATPVIRAAVVAVMTPTPNLIVVANVALVAATATRVAAVAVVRSSAAQSTTAPSGPAPTAVAPTAIPPIVLAPPPAGDVAAAEQYTVGLINAQRRALGLTPLAADVTLMAIANSRVADMVARGYTGHNDPVTGEALGPKLMRAAGFGGQVGENWYGTRLGPPTIADVAMKWFMTDPPHYENILGRRYDSVGVGIAFNGQQWLLIQDFAGH